MKLEKSTIVFNFEDSQHLDGDLQHLKRQLLHELLEHVKVTTEPVIVRNVGGTKYTASIEIKE